MRVSILVPRQFDLCWVLFGVERCPLLGGSSSMIKSIGGKWAVCLYRGCPLCGGSVIRGFTVTTFSYLLPPLLRARKLCRWVKVVMSVSVNFLLHRPFLYNINVYWVQRFLRGLGIFACTTLLNWISQFFVFHYFSANCWSIKTFCDAAHSHFNIQQRHKQFCIVY